MVSRIPIKTRLNQFRMSTTKHFFNVESVKLCSFFMVNAGKWGAKMKKWGRCQLAIAKFYVLPALPSQLSVFLKFCIMNTLLHFLLLICQSCRSLRNESMGGCILGSIITVG